MRLTQYQLDRMRTASSGILAECSSFLAALCRIDTTNPPGLNYRESARLFGDHLASLGYDSRLLLVDDADLPALGPHGIGYERVNVIGTKKSDAREPQKVTQDGVTREKTLHFNGHFDMFPTGDPETWSYPPLGAEIVEIDGQKCMVARGVSDMKALSMVARVPSAIWAIEALKRADLKLRGTIEHSGVVDEESIGIRNAGAGWLVEQGFVSPKTVDAVVITEPLNVENVCLGHRGAIWGEIKFHGVASHGATPQRGANAFVHAASFIVRANQEIIPTLQGKRDEQVIPAEARNASLTFTVLNAGANTNSVPDLAVLRFDRRLVPGETLEEARSQIHTVLKACEAELGGPDTFRYTYSETYSTEPVWVDEGLEVCKVWAEAVEKVVGQKARIVCSPGSDDQRFFVRGGIPQCLLYGPGNIRQVHTRDETLHLEDLRQAIEVMAIGAADFLGGVEEKQWAEKYAEAQATGGRAARFDQAGAWDKAFSTYISAAQTYLYLLRNTEDSETRTRLRDTAAKLVQRAERIKAERKLDGRAHKRNILAPEEQDAVLAAGCNVQGLRLDRWKTEHGQEVPASQPVSPLPALCAAQLAQSCTWLPAMTAVPNAVLYERDTRGTDIYQGNFGNCSFVAALIVAAEHNVRYGSKLALSCLHPQDGEGFPKKSSSGCHSIRLLVNGTWRKIDIDHRLPVSRSDSTSYASTWPQEQLWPALLEKAYLCVMGGYDFAGSNSANDFYALTGWLPESITLGPEGRNERLWTRISRAYKLGLCVFTLGTGKAEQEKNASRRLVPSHNYAVVDMREEGGRRRLLLVNPRRSKSRRWTHDLREALEGIEESDEVFVVEWEEVPSLFTSLHLNWDPGVFDHSDTVHCSATPPASSGVPTYRHTSRFGLQTIGHSREGSDVWLFLARHTSSPLEKGEYVSVSMTAGRPDSESQVLQKLDDRTSMTDSPFFLYRFSPTSPSSDIIVSHEGASSTFSCTLQAYSNTSIKLLDGSLDLPYSVSAQGCWSGSTAGGNHTCCTFLNNPQYHIKLAAAPGKVGGTGELDILAETAKDSPVNLRLFLSDGERVGDFEQRDVVAGNADYAYGQTSIRKGGLQPGSYSLAVSSFQPRHQADFKLFAQSSLPVEIVPIPAEGAGKYARQVDGRFGAGAHACTTISNTRQFRLKVSKATSIKFRLQLPERPKPIALFLYAASADGTPGRLVSSTMPYADPVCGVALLSRLEPRQHGYIVVPSLFGEPDDESFRLLAYADSPIELV
ncbi:hypothetical protein JCM11641_007539 [Rhodosporidiobolus odoratus]